MLWMWLRPWAYLGALVGFILLLLVIVITSPQSVFGDLAQWPLSADVWGSFGQWVGAIGTGGGALIAATVYRHNSQREREAQARLVRVVTTSSPIIGPQSMYPEPFTIIVYNYSDKPIFNLESGIDKRMLGEVILPLLDMPSADIRVSDEVLETHLKNYKETKTNFFFPFPADFKLDPEFGYRFAYGEPITEYHRPWISFTDAAGEYWHYSIPTVLDDVASLAHGPRDSWSKMTKTIRIMDSIHSPSKAIKRVGERRRLFKWLRTNHNGL